MKKTVSWVKEIHNQNTELTLHNCIEFSLHLEIKSIIEVRIEKVGLKGTLMKNI